MGGTCWPSGEAPKIEPPKRAKGSKAAMKLMAQADVVVAASPNPSASESAYQVDASRESSSLTSPSQSESVLSQYSLAHGWMETSLSSQSVASAT